MDARVCLSHCAPVEKDAIDKDGKYKPNERSQRSRGSDICQRPHRWCSRKLRRNGCLQVWTITVDQTDPAPADQPCQRHDVSRETNWVPQPISRTPETPEAHHLRLQNLYAKRREAVRKAEVQSCDPPRTGLDN